MMRQASCGSTLERYMKWGMRRSRPERHVLAGRCLRHLSPPSGPVAHEHTLAAERSFASRFARAVFTLRAPFKSAQQQASPTHRKRVRRHKSAMHDIVGAQGNHIYHSALDAWWWTQCAIKDFAHMP